MAHSPPGYSTQSANHLEGGRQCCWPSVSPWLCRPPPLAQTGSWVLGQIALYWVHHGDWCSFVENSPGHLVMWSMNTTAYLLLQLLPHSATAHKQMRGSLQRLWTWHKSGSFVVQLWPPLRHLVVGTLADVVARPFISMASVLGSVACLPKPSGNMLGCRSIFWDWDQSPCSTSTTEITDLGLLQPPVADLSHHHIQLVLPSYPLEILI